MIHHAGADVNSGCNKRSAALTGPQPEVLFRDYLNAHPADAKAYEALKLSLWKPYEHNRDGYTQAKTAFVQEILRRAGEEIGAENR